MFLLVPEATLVHSPHNNYINININECGYSKTLTVAVDVDTISVDLFVATTPMRGNPQHPLTVPQIPRNHTHTQDAFGTAECHYFCIHRITCPSSASHSAKGIDQTTVRAIEQALGQNSETYGAKTTGQDKIQLIYEL